MICILCNDTGLIDVKSIESDGKHHSEIKKPCPMGCVAHDKSLGVGGSQTLAGNEMTLEEAREMFPIDERKLKKKPFTDYAKGGDKVDWKKHYGLKG